jgi:hypothetical protein
VRVLLRLALMTRPKLLDSPPMIDLLSLTTRLKRLNSSPPIDLLSLTTRLKRLDSSPPIDLLSLSKLRGTALRRWTLVGEGPTREYG